MPLTDTGDLQQLAMYRSFLGDAKDRLAKAQACMLATPEGLAMEEAKQSLLALRSYIADSEATIRGTALEHYDGTGEKEPWPGVKIKLYTVVKYASQEALTWAKENSPNLLTLDKSAFNKAVKANLTGPIGVVATEPRAQIARDLSQYLPSVAEPIPEGEETEQ